MKAEGRDGMKLLDIESGFEFLEGFSVSLTC